MQRCITFSLQHHETVDKSLKIPAAWYKAPFCGARSADFAGCSRRGRCARVSSVCGQLWCAKRLCKALFSAESTLGAAASASAVNGLASSRAGSLPQGDGGGHRFRKRRRSIVGAGLLAKAVGLLAGVVNGLPSSRAGSLPQGVGGGHRFKERRRSTVGASSRWRWVGRSSGLFRPSVRPPGSSPTPAPARCAVCARAPAG